MYRTPAVYLDVVYSNAKEAYLCIQKVLNWMYNNSIVNALYKNV